MNGRGNTESYFILPKPAAIRDAEVTQVRNSAGGNRRACVASILSGTGVGNLFKKAQRRQTTIPTGGRRTSRPKGREHRYSDRSEQRSRGAEQNTTDSASDSVITSSIQTPAVPRLQARNQSAPQGERTDRNTTAL